MLLLLSIAVGLGLGVGACGALNGKDKAAEGAEAAAVPGRPLADIELPVSLRTFDPAPNNAAVVEATDGQLRLDGAPVVELIKGKVGPTDQSGGFIPKLEERLRSPMRSTLALRLQANVPYETVALVMNTARKAGTSNVAFAVRTLGGGDKTGWLNVDGFTLASKAEDLPPFAGIEPKSWNVFTDKWQSVFDACRTAPMGNCAYVTDNVAQGGTLRIELMTSGRGMNVNFFRRGLNHEQELVEDQQRAAILSAKKESFLQGRITHDEMVEALLLGDPSTYALFQFRYQEALKSPSAISKTMAPMCHSERCGVVVTANNVSTVLNVVSLIGAAFPDGTKLPAFAFELPWTERPKPAVLADWIKQQQAL
jgi:hypothetical protein